MTEFLWVAVICQILMGAFDTLFHHEGTERLAWRPTQARELRLHGVRNLAYAVMFLVLGWSEPRGLWALAFITLLLAELLITLWDFVEEDKTRRLPATERITHTLLALNYGIILALLVPKLLMWAAMPTGLRAADHGLLAWFCSAAAAGVAIFGLRDLAAARRCVRLGGVPASRLAEAIEGHKSVLITGGTGFIGARLVGAMAAAGHDVTVLTRNRVRDADLPAPIRIVTKLDQIPDEARLDAIVNLAGEPISDRPWTRLKRLRILRSRLQATRDVLHLIKRLERKPEVLISGSAVGWYGLRGDQPLTEVNLGTPCFSRRLCVAWERWGEKAQLLGVRTVLLRTGLVLDSCGGMLARLLTPFEFALGGRLGNGNQWMSWIHRDDLVRLIVHGIATPTLRGPLNGTAPEPVTNRLFTANLARALKRPAAIPIPAWPLRKLLGDFAEELLLSGQRVLPKAALQSGFRFWYPTIAQALGAIINGDDARATTGTRGRPKRLAGNAICIDTICADQGT